MQAVVLHSIAVKDSEKPSYSNTMKVTLVIFAAMAIIACAYAYPAEEAVPVPNPGGEQPQAVEPAEETEGLESAESAHWGGRGWGHRGYGGGWGGRGYYGGGGWGYGGGYGGGWGGYRRGYGGGWGWGK